MGTFSIKDIEAVSGIKCHTLRTWEQRYNIVSPKRTETNIRFYDDDDLRLILNISTLNRFGYRISEISKMTSVDIAELVRKCTDHESVPDDTIKSLLHATMLFDETGFNKLLTARIRDEGMIKVMTEIVMPLLNEIGILWQVGTMHPSHEHFVTNLIKQKLYVAIDEFSGTYRAEAKQFLLFLPESEQHTIGLLFANYLVRSHGHKVLYLGQGVPVKELHNILEGYCPHYILTILTSNIGGEELQSMTDTLSLNWPDSKIFLSGKRVIDAPLLITENTRIFKSVEDFIRALDSMQ